MNNQIKIEDYDKGILLYEQGDTLLNELAYSNVSPPKKIQYVGVNISHVRASDGIRIHYDYDRDGYVIEQPYSVEVDKGDHIECVEVWQETAFLQSWALSKEENNE